MSEQDKLLEALGIIPSLISPASIAEQLEDEEHAAMDLAREKKILDDMAECGSFFHQIDPSNGRKLIKYRVSCGYWRRGCQRCLNKRTSDFETRFLNCVRDTDGGTFLGIAQMSKKEAGSITRKMRKAGTEYWRVPTPSGSFILIFDSLHFSELDNPELHDSLRWAELCQTPKGSRYSGNLGRREEKKEGIVVKIPRFKLGNMNERIINTAWSKAIEDTKSYNPAYDVEEIEECLQSRMDCFEESIESMGGEILEKYRVMTRVKEEDFGWKVGYDDNDYKIQSTLGTIPPPGFVKEAEIDYGKLKDELWPV